MCGDHCFRSYSIAAASRGRCAVCSGHRDDERSLRVAGLPRRKGTRETTYAAMAYVDDRAAILAYHEATKHSPVSVRARAHDLDWNNRPSSFKVYADLERIPLPQDILPLDVPALEAIGVTSVPDPAPGPDLAALARLLVLGCEADGADERVDFLAERPGLVDQFLRLLAVVPERFPGHLGVEFAEALLHLGDVKETSASGQVSRRLSSTAL